MAPKKLTPEPYGNPEPFAEPSWYNALASPYYNESHRRVRDYVRRYVEEYIAPNIQVWEENGLVPDEARIHYVQAGLAFPEMPREYAQGAKRPGEVPAEGERNIFNNTFVFVF